MWAAETTRHLNSLRCRGRKHRSRQTALGRCGTDVNAKTGLDATPLHFAAREGHKELVELLIANGADVNAKRESGYTPLNFAAGRGHK